MKTTGKVKSVKISGRKPRILFVDDEEMICELYGKMLQRLGYEVSVITNSVEALETFKASPYNYDLVITDQTMPKLTGLDLVSKFRKKRSDISIILCTGYSELISPKMVSCIGIDKILMKPVSIRQMQEAITSTLSGGCD